MQADNVTFQFGRFTLDPARRCLLAGGAPISLSSRAFDILQLLVEGRDRVLGKDEILTQVWRGMAVEENNLAVQISSLRRALAEPGAAALIATVPGQGYRFVGEVAEHIVIPPVVAPAIIREPLAERPVLAPVVTHAPAAPSRPSWIFAASGAAAMILAMGVWLLVRAPSAPESVPAPRLSLVVLPFRNLSGDPKQDYLADAVSDDLTTDLSHIPGSTVIARASSDTYKGRAVAADEIGRALHVRYLLEGSIRGEDNMFRINAQLIDTSNGAHLWADRFDVGESRISDAQTDIVRHIASALNVQLVAIEGARSLHERPDDPDALDLFFRARSITDRAHTLADYSAAQAMLEKAIALQPRFAEALSNLGWLLLTKRSDFDDPGEATDLEKARLVIARALTIAPENADVLAVSGALHASDGRCQEAQASYDAAIAAEPNNVLGHAGRAVCSWRLGQPQATIAQLTEVMRLDPLGPAAKYRYAMIGMAHFMTGEWQKSVEWLLKSLSGDPDGPASSIGREEWSRAFLMAAYSQLGDNNRARREYLDFDRKWPNRTIWRLSSYFSKAQASMPHFASWKNGLEAAGMPVFADERLAPSLAQVSLTDPAKHSDGDFDPVPLQVPGAVTVDAKAVAEIIKRSPAPVILDVGKGAGVIPGATWRYQREFAGLSLVDIVATLRKKSVRDSGIVVVSAGPFGWSGYDAALSLARSGETEMYWFRGGEEAWAREGRPSSDLREP